MAEIGGGCAASRNETAGHRHAARAPAERSPTDAQMGRLVDLQTTENADAEFVTVDMNMNVRNQHGKGWLSWIRARPRDMQYRAEFRSGKTQVVSSNSATVEKWYLRAFR